TAFPGADRPDLDGRLSGRLPGHRSTVGRVPFRGRYGRLAFSARILHCHRVSAVGLPNRSVWTRPRHHETGSLGPRYHSGLRRISISARLSDEPGDARPEFPVELPTSVDQPPGRSEWQSDRALFLASWPGSSSLAAWPGGRGGC